jgi:hypothetical protein
VFDRLNASRTLVVGNAIYLAVQLPPPLPAAVFTYSVVDVLPSVRR